MKIKKYIILLIGVIIEALSFVIFLDANNLCATDVGGLSVIFNRLYNIDTSLFILIGNLLLIIVSFVFLGRHKTIKTIFGSIAMPLVIFISKPLVSLIDFSSIDVVLLAVLGGITTGIGNGIVFKSGYTTGGTDIIEDIFTKYFKMSLGTAIMIVDGFVVIAGGLAFGIEPMIYSLIALIMMSVFSNRKLIGIDEDKILLITTKNKKKVIDYMTKHYQYGLTIMDAVGRYQNSESDFIMCSVSSRNYYKIKKALASVEPNAFIIILNSYDTKYAHKDERKRPKKIKA